MLRDRSRAMGKDWNRAAGHKVYLVEIGFVDVVEKGFSCSIVPWARDEKNKTLGVYGRATLLQGVGALSMAISTGGLGMTTVDIEFLLVDVRNDISKNGYESIHVYVPM